MIEKSKYKSLTEWKNANNWVYKVALKKGLIQKLCDTFGWKNTSTIPENFWNSKEKILTEALKYSRKSDWNKKSGGSYAAAKRFNIFEECTKHMIVIQEDFVEKGVWNIKQNLINEVKKYYGKNEWRKKSGGSYHAAVRNGWLEECLTYLHEIIKPKGYWTKENIINESKKYSTRKEWKEKCKRTYKIASNEKWIKDCPVYAIKYTKKECINDAKNFSSKTEWGHHRRKSTYKAAKENGWFEECTKHMTKKKDDREIKI